MGKTRLASRVEPIQEQRERKLILIILATAGISIFVANLAATRGQLEIYFHLGQDEPFFQNKQIFFSARLQNFD